MVGGFVDQVGERAYNVYEIVTQKQGHHCFVVFPFAGGCKRAVKASHAGGKGPRCYS